MRSIVHPSVFWAIRFSFHFSCVTIKFLGPRQDTAERLGIIGINLYGYEQNEDVVTQEKNMELQTWLLPEDEEALVPGETVLLQCLKFLQVL